MGKLKLLLVDDDTLVLATFSKELKMAGFDVITADNGKDGLDIAAKKQSLDLVVLDVKMPQMSGIEVASALKQMGIPWIFLSASNDTETVTLATEEGSLGYLVKPIEVSMAVPTIISAIKTSKNIVNFIENEVRLTGAIDTGAYVNVAVGLLMERHKLNKQEAFEIIRSKARSEQRKVKDVSMEVLDAWHTFNLIQS